MAEIVDTALDKKTKVKKYLIGVLISFIVTTALFGAMILFQIAGGQLNFEENAHLIFANATFVGGLIMACVYVLLVLSNNGAYDLLTYSVKLVWYNTFHKNVRKTKLAASYADYREEKNRKRTTGNSFLLVGALPYLVCGIIYSLILMNS